MSRDKRSYRSTQRTRRGAVTTFGSRTDVGCVNPQLIHQAVFAEINLITVCDRHSINDLLKKFCAPRAHLTIRQAVKDEQIHPEMV